MASETEMREDLELVYLALEEGSLADLPLVLLHQDSLISMVRFAVAGALAGEYELEELPALVRSWWELAEEVLPAACDYGLAN